MRPHFFASRYSLGHAFKSTLAPSTRVVPKPRAGGAKTGAPPNIGFIYGPSSLMVFLFMVFVFMVLVLNFVVVLAALIDLDVTAFKVTRGAVAV